MAWRILVIKKCNDCPLIMLGTRGFYCDKNPDLIRDLLSIPDTCELSIA